MLNHGLPRADQLVCDRLGPWPGFSLALTPGAKKNEKFFPARNSISIAVGGGSKDASPGTGLAFRWSMAALDGAGGVKNKSNFFENVSQNSVRLQLT